MFLSNVLTGCLPLRVTVRPHASCTLADVRRLIASRSSRRKPQFCRGLYEPVNTQGPVADT